MTAGPDPRPGAAPLPSDSVRERRKRAFDLAAIALAGVPLLLLAGGAALAVRLCDGAPVLYRQARLGRGGRVFTLCKFRTMAVDAEARTGPVWAAPGDARVSAAGRVLRRFHLDELPQLANVLRGEMSLVGPRPERPELAARVERALPGFAARLAVRPGIAGLAQACCPAPVTPRRKLRYDLVYIARMGPWLDARILALCLLRVALGRPWRARRRGGRRPRRNAAASPRTQWARGRPGP